MAAALISSAGRSLVEQRVVLGAARAESLEGAQQRRRGLLLETGVCCRCWAPNQGRAELDIDGSGTLATAAELMALGIGLAERVALVGLYAAGDTFLRLAVNRQPFGVGLPFSSGEGAGSTPPSVPGQIAPLDDATLPVAPPVAGVLSQSLPLMDKRLVLVGEYLEGERAMTELCLEYGVSRKTGYKWVGRYNDGGPSALEDRSRTPFSPNARGPIVLEALVQARRARPHWGARKILAWLSGKQPEFDLPLASTVSELFARYRLSRARQARRRTPLTPSHSVTQTRPIESGALTSKATSRRATTSVAML